MILCYGPKRLWYAEERKVFVMLRNEASQRKVHIDD